MTKSALSVSTLMVIAEFTATVKETRVAAAMKEYFLEIMVKFFDKRTMLRILDLLVSDTF